MAGSGLTLEFGWAVRGLQPLAQVVYERGEHGHRREGGVAGDAAPSPEKVKLKVFLSPLLYQNV